MAKARKHSKKSSRAKTWAWRVFLTLGLVVGLALVFNEQIKLFVVDWMSRSTLSTLDQKVVAKNNKKKATYDFSKVNDLDLGTVGNAAMNTKNAIGMIAIPKVSLHLPIMKGLANDNLSVGAATMTADQKMGEGNYALAGHDTSHKGVLFSPLGYVKAGDNVYLTDMKNVYRYKVTLKKNVDQYEVHWVDPVPNQKLITLITCEVNTATRADRIMVRGELTKVSKATNKRLKVFKADK
ncbi:MULTISPECIES: class A sortase [Lacticaseibacillus]|uniref:Class A sortase n=1 Tax=Lacticaseibacillus hegangensis TaxID=2486010 RepID=A0ABW4CYZ4_9LACO|nr:MULTISPECIES: class A sortase [Lacticaseibacillus]